VLRDYVTKVKISALKKNKHAQIQIRGTVSVDIIISGTFLGWLRTGRSWLEITGLAEEGYEGYCIQCLDFKEIQDISVNGSNCQMIFLFLASPMEQKLA
jgi:hypothetical protein